MKQKTKTLSVAQTAHEKTGSTGTRSDILRLTIAKLGGCIDGDFANVRGLVEEACNEGAEKVFPDMGPPTAKLAAVAADIDQQHVIYRERGEEFCKTFEPILTNVLKLELVRFELSIAACACIAFDADEEFRRTAML